MAALEGITYLDTGLNTKPKANMNDFFYMEGDRIDYNLLDYNLTKFKQINNI